jgi:MazG family protein
MIRRHPHVFADATIAGSDAQSVAWEEHKASERQARAARNGSSQSILDDVPLALPALMRAQKLQKRAARVGFDWPRLDQVIAKLHEELGEVQEEIDDDADRPRLSDEIGDVLFAAVNLARWLDIDPEEALRGANAKFERRFHHIESTLAQEGRAPADAELHEMEAIWQCAKRAETT